MVVVPLGLDPDLRMVLQVPGARARATAGAMAMGTAVASGAGHGHLWQL